MADLGGATTLYICPTCGCPDLMTKSSALALPAAMRDAQCPNCNWTGKLSEAAGIATTEKVYDTKTILNLLLYVVTKHAAGPIAQAFQFFGLVEKGDQAGLDHIMREATSGLIEKAFMAAAENAAKKGQLAETAEKNFKVVSGDPNIEPVALGDDVKANLDTIVKNMEPT
jgi:DNA-directed RNA polymerase subunit RPC12/RpoP